MLHLLPVTLLVVAAVLLSVAGLREWGAMPWTGIKTATQLGGTAEGPRRIVNVTGGSPADQAGIESGQWLVSVEGHPAKPGPELTQLREQLSPGDELTVQVADAPDGRPRDVTLTLGSHLRHFSSQIRVAASAITLLGFLAIGVFVFWRRPADVRAQLLLWFSGFLGPFYLLIDAYGFRMTLSGDPLMSAGFRSVVIALVFGGISTALLGHFVLVFPRRRPVLASHPKLLHFLYGLYAVLLALAGINVSFFLVAARTFERTGEVRTVGQLAAQHVVSLADWVESQPLVSLGLCLLLLVAAAFLATPVVRGLLAGERLGAVWDRPGRSIGSLLLGGILAGLMPIVLAELVLPDPLDKPVGVFGVLALMLGPLAAALGVPFVHTIVILATLARSYRDSGAEERRQLRWPIWGIGAYFVLGVALAVIQVLTVNAAFWMVPLTDLAGKLLGLLIPLSFAFAIARYRLMDIDLVIRKSVAYAGLTGLVGALFLVLAIGLGGLLTSVVGLEDRWSTLGAGVLAVALFVPLRTRVQRRLEGWVFRNRQRFPRILSQLEQSLSDARKDEEVAFATAEALQDGVPNRGVAVLLAAGRERLLRPAAKVGDLPEVTRLEIALPPEPLEELPTGAGPVSIEHLPAEEEGRARLRSQLGAQLLLPLSSGDRLLGVATLGRLASSQELDEPERIFLADVAARAARRIDELDLEEQAQTLEQARRIQQNLLPRRLPQLPGLDVAARYLPCEGVGGDYYDVVPLGEDRVGVVIADVSGKGVPAALLMSNCQAAFRSLVGLGLRPGELCGRLNEVINSNVAPEQFVTLCYAEIDPRTATLELVNAGHVRPALVSADGGFRWLELPGGLPLGIMGGESYQPERLRLTPREKLLLFTDGVNEAQSPAGDLFDETSLEAALQRVAELDASASVDRLFDELQRFTAKNPDDDVTVVAVSLA